jgi:PPOX class probable FMN-dependent enzyme
VRPLPGQIVTTEAQLRALIGEPAELTCAKISDRLNSATRVYVERSPLVCLATSDAAGRCDLSPRGDPAGFVRVLDERTLLIPERPGNRLADSLLNILANPHIGLLFIVPGVTDTFRVNGRATVTVDAELLAPCAVEGKLPLLGIQVDIEEAYTQCSKAFLRSHHACTRNFVGRDLYGALDCAWLHRLAADGLERAAACLACEAPGHRVLVLDALRPQRVQEQLWAALEGTGLRQYVADPALGSIHSFGMALDVTLLDPAGQEFDMGSGFDEMNERSHPRLEPAHLASGVLTPVHVRHRELLRRAMAAGGFNGVDNEWWHFDMLERQHVRRQFVRVA